MQIILLERVPNLGQMGDVVSVKPGFARNFLLPKNKALRATDANKKLFAARRKDIEAQNLKRREEAEAAAATMNGARIVLVRQAGEAGQLYGSATARDIAEQLGEVGYKVGRSQVELNKPIKELGIHSVIVRLHPDVTVDISVNVARSAAEAEQQWQLGGAVLSEEAREAAAEAEAEEQAELNADELVESLLAEDERASQKTDD